MRPFFLAQVMLFCCFDSAIGAESTFAWRNSLGARFDDLQSELIGVAECQNLKDFDFRLPPNPSRITLDEFSSWSDPAAKESHTILDESFRSKRIKIGSCTTDDKINIQAMTFDEQIFSLIIEYRSCINPDSNCSFDAKQFDRDSFESLKDELAVLPSFGNGSISPEEFEKFQTYQNRIDAFSKPLNVRSQMVDCFFYGLNDRKWRCLAGYDYDKSVLHSFGFAEILDGQDLGIGKNIVFVSQSFVHQKLAMEAAENFLTEVNLAIDQIALKSEGQDQKAKQAKKILQSIQ
jgi:hypothetical protein